MCTFGDVMVDKLVKRVSSPLSSDDTKHMGPNRSRNSISSNFRPRTVKDDIGDEVISTCQKRVYSLYYACM